MSDTGTGSSGGGLADFEQLIRQALAPVDPPEGLSSRLETTLSDITDLVAEELDQWELSAIRDPKQWPGIPRAAAAAVVGTAAGAGLVVLRTRSRARRRTASDPLDFVEDTVRTAVDEARKLLDR